jgi:hypothetical protein
VEPLNEEKIDLSPAFTVVQRTKYNDDTALAFSVSAEESDCRILMLAHDKYDGGMACIIAIVQIVGVEEAYADVMWKVIGALK